MADENNQVIWKAVVSVVNFAVDGVFGVGFRLRPRQRMIERHSLRLIHRCLILGMFESAERHEKVGRIEKTIAGCAHRNRRSH